MKLTAYKFWITETPMSEEEFEGYCGDWIWGQGKNRLRRGTEMEEVFSLETDDKKLIEDMKRRMDEWRTDGLVYAYQIVEGIRVEQHQYMRENKASNKRIWREVRSYDQSYKTIKFALTGRDY